MKKRSKLWFHLLALPLLIVAMAVGSWAKDVTLQLDVNEDPNVAGYRIYYKAGTPDGPFDGTGAVEGASPIDIGPSLNATISGLKGQVYYFAVTAYDAWGDESEFSNVISSHWAPVANFPENQISLSPGRVDFAWEAPTVADEIVSYKLVYTTDPSALPGNKVAQAYPVPALLAGMSFLALAGFGMNSKRRTRLFVPLGFACLIFLASGCGGGGDSDLGLIGNGSQLDTAKVQVLTVENNSHTVYDLEPSTTYYWQVVAVHADGIEQESPIYSFTTEAF